MKKDTLLEQLIQAHTRFQEALNIPPHAPLSIDGTIQRFEFTFELTWKTLKAFLEDQGIPCYSPRSCLKEAFKAGWIEDEEGWLALLKSRNLTAHVYSEDMAKEIYGDIRERSHLFRKMIEALEMQDVQ